MPGVIRWVTSHRKVCVFVVGVALTTAVQVWGTDNPYVSVAILTATGLGFYHTPDTGTSPAARAQAAKAGEGPDLAYPPPGPGITAPAARAGTTGLPPSAVADDAAAGAGRPAEQVIRHYPPGRGWRRW